MNREDPFDLTNSHGKHSKYNPLSRIPENIRNYIRVVLFALAMVVGIPMKVKQPSWYILWGILLVIQVIIVVVTAKKKKKEREKEEAESTSEEAFMKAINNNDFGGTPIQNEKFQAEKETKVYNADSDVVFEEYDLSEELEKQEGNSSYNDADGF